MKNITPRQLAIVIAFIFTFISLLLLVANRYSSNFIITIVVSLPVIFVFSYFLVNYILNYFIYDKIKPIYKTIHAINTKEGAKRERNRDEDIITMVNNEVADWAKNKTQEIKQLKQLEKYRKEFLGNVSHELKTPIFNIQGYILTLLDGGMEDAEINKLYLTRTEKSIDRMISIIEDLEAISKLESGELKLNYERFNIAQVTDDVFEMQEIRAEEKNIKLQFATNVEKPIYVWADKQRVFQILSNLVVNAIKYGREGGQVNAGFYDMDNKFLIEISDDGIGIESNHLLRIFERFYRVDKSRSREQGGTGLGLAIVKHLIEAHNQTINVKSKPNEGTTFTFTLEKG